MRTVLFMLAGLLAITKISSAQDVRVRGGSFPMISSLRSAVGVNGVVVDVGGMTSSADGLGGTYMYNSSNTSTDDSFLVVKPAAVQTGRWLRLRNENTVKGSYTGNGVVLKFRFTVTHNLGYVPTMVIIQPTSLAAAVLNWVDKSSFTTTTFDVVFLTAPAAGILNVSFDWVAIKK